MDLDRRLASRMTSSRLVGAFFLAGFLLYGIGFALVTSVVDRPDFLATVPEHRTTLLLGVFLMLLNTVVDVGKGVLLLPVLARHSSRAAYAYFATMVVEVVLLAGGALLFLLLVPLSEEAPAGWTAGVAELLVDANDSAYQLGEMLLGIGALSLTVVLVRTRLVPRGLALLGVAGYALLAVGSAADLMGAHVGLALSLPGGLFEVGLGFWLLVKGFRAAAYDATTQTPRTPSLVAPVAEGAGVLVAAGTHTSDTL